MEYRKFEFRNVELHVVPFTCSPLTNQKVDLVKTTYGHLTNLPLADCYGGVSQLKIDVLIGADCYWRFELENIVQPNQGPACPL